MPTDMLTEVANVAKGWTECLDEITPAMRRGVEESAESLLATWRSAGVDVGPHFIFGVCAGVSLVDSMTDHMAQSNPLAGLINSMGSASPQTMSALLV